MTPNSKKTNKETHCFLQQWHTWFVISRIFTGEWMCLLHDSLCQWWLFSWILCMQVHGWNHKKMMRHCIGEQYFYKVLFLGTVPKLIYCWDYMYLSEAVLALMSCYIWGQFTDFYTFHLVIIGSVMTKNRQTVQTSVKNLMRGADFLSACKWVLSYIFGQMKRTNRHTGNYFNNIVIKIL